MEIIISPSESIIYKSDEMVAVLADAEAATKNELPVMIYGPTGVGKELFVKYIHGKSNKIDPLITVNCGAITESLAEDEFFGHEKGSFTGADKLHIGYFESSNNGTLFLDEISELSLNLQTKILRVIQENKIRRIGSNKEINWNGRLICSTNRNLEYMAAQHKFRKDLYYRINVFNIRIPPLRNRKNDILVLIGYFFDKYTELFKSRLFFIGTEVKNYLLEYDWPGNVRELESSLLRAVARAKGKTELTLSVIDKDLINYVDQKRNGQIIGRREDDFFITDRRKHENNDTRGYNIPEQENQTKLSQSDSNLANSDFIDFEKLIREKEISLLKLALTKAGNNKTKAAEYLRLNRTTFIRKLKFYGLLDQ